MDTKDIVIVALIIIVVFMVGLFFGQRKNRNTNQQNTNDKNSSVEAELHQKAVTESVALQSTKSQEHSIKPLKDYSRELEFFEGYSQKLNQLALKLNENAYFQIFNDQYQGVTDAYEKFNLNKQEATPEEWRKLVSSIISSFSFGNVVSHVQEKADKMAELLLEEYQEHLDVLFKGKDFERLSDRYQLNSDLKAEQLRKISSAIAGKFNTVVFKARESDQKIEWLKVNYENFVQLTSDKSDIGSMARNFAGGALAVANPLIGIPMLVANWMGESKKDDQNDIFIASYGQKWEELESTIDSLRQEIIAAIEKANIYLSEKTEEIIGRGTRTILCETAAAGHSIDHYFIYVKESALPEVEKANIELQD